MANYKSVFARGEPILETFGEKEKSRTVTANQQVETFQFDPNSNSDRTVTANQQVETFQFDPNSNSDKLLDISVRNGEVLIRPGNEDSVKIEMNGTSDQLSQFIVEQDGSQIILKQKSSSTSFTVSGGSVFQSFGNGIHIGGVDGIHIGSGCGNVICGSGNVIGNVSGGRFFNSWINGVYYDHNGNPQNGTSVSTLPQNLDPVKFVIYTPSDMVYDINISGNAKLESTILYKSLKLSLSGIAKADFIGGGDSKVKSSGNSKCNIDDIGGKFKCSTSGACKTTVAGDFTSVDISASGATGISTNGTCAGDYHASASGAAKISHKGTVEGRVKRSASGAAKINV